ncbi:MAG TPA: KH domain-containing protein [Thermoanaerobaculia bacterium]|nr:KH domain-containing protein [Thermoanaerobaculia bacterium]
MKELIEFLAKSLVDEPDEVEIRTRNREGATVIELMVAENDLGKVIGRQGRTARAMRTLLTAAGNKQRRRYILDILD